MDQALSEIPITVLLPVYNSAEYLGATIRSILDQTYAEFELLIIDDLSTDGCREVIRSFQDERMITVFHERNIGLSATLNEGIEMAKGKYIARMDGDDLMHPERLGIQKRFLDEHPDVAVVASTVDLMNTEGEITGVWDTDRACITAEQIRNMMPKTNCIAHPSVMMRKSALGSNPYAHDQKDSEDWDLWMRLLSQGRTIAKIDRPLLKYRVHPASMMGMAKRKVALEKRLMRARKNFILREWRSAQLSTFQASVAKAQARTFARHLLNTVRSGSRNLKRTITYSAGDLKREAHDLKIALENWHGRHILLFPYMHMGGAEQVHARIARSIADQGPLVIIHGFSQDRSMYERFAASGTVIELPHLLNHPARAQQALGTLAGKLNTTSGAVVIGALSGVFFDLLPLLKNDVRTIYLQHAFLHQPTGNAKHKEWLVHFDRVDHFVFIAKHALEEYRNFLFANNIPRSAFSKAEFISNAVDRYRAPEPHGKIGILFVGRDSDEKRMEIFLRICDQLHASAPDRFRFTVIGPAERGVNAPVQFIGMITDDDVLQDHYAQHDLLLVTSSREGFPMVIMEAMAMGLAVLSTPVGDVPNRLTNEVAIITSTVDADVVIREMVDAILGLERDRDLLARMRQAAYQYAVKEFDPEKFRQAYRDLLIRPASSI